MWEKGLFEGKTKKYSFHRWADIYFPSSSPSSTYSTGPTTSIRYSHFPLYISPRSGYICLKIETILVRKRTHCLVFDCGENCLFLTSYVFISPIPGTEGVWLTEPNRKEIISSLKATSTSQLDLLKREKHCSKAQKLKSPKAQKLKSPKAQNLKSSGTICDQDQKNSTNFEAVPVVVVVPQFLFSTYKPHDRLSLLVLYDSA